MPPVVGGDQAGCQHGQIKQRPCGHAAQPPQLALQDAAAPFHKPEKQLDGRQHQQHACRRLIAGHDGQTGRSTGQRQKRPRERLRQRIQEQRDGKRQKHGKTVKLVGKVGHGEGIRQHQQKHRRQQKTVHTVGQVPFGVQDQRVTQDHKRQDQRQRK